MSKKCTLLWREAHFEVKMYKALQLRNTFRSCDVEKVHTVLWREAHFQVKVCKTPHAPATFRRWSVVLRGRRKGLCTLSKVSKTWGFCSISKIDGRRGTFEEDLQRCIFRAGAVQETCSPEMLGGEGADFLVTFWSIRSSVLGRWVCWQVQHFVLPGITFSWQAQYFRLVRGRQLCTQLCRNRSFLMLSTSKFEEVSQTCFVFDVVKLKNWGSLAELFRFWRCKAQNLRTSRRIAAFSSLQLDRQTGRQTDRRIDG